MGAILRPRRRAVDRAAMRPDGYHVGELAFRRKGAGDVLVVGGHSAKFLAGSFVGIENDDGFPRTLLEVVEWRDEVCIARDENDTVEVGLDMVDEHLGGNVHVGALLFGFPHCRDGNLLAGLAGFLCKRIAGAESFIVALDDLQFIVFFISIFQKGKGRTFVRPCTASPRLSGR